MLGGTISGAGYIERGDPTQVRRNIVTVTTSGILRDKTINEKLMYHHIDVYQSLDKNYLLKFEHC